MITFSTGYQNPYKLYGSAKRSDMIYNLEDIYPKLKYIYGDQETFLSTKN